MSYETERPYIASYVILRNDNKIAFVLRTNTSWMNGHYGLPAGKVEKGETFTAAVIREAKEEVGIGIKPEDIKPLLTLQRFEPGGLDTSSWVDICFEATKWSGQPYNAEPTVHGEFVWLDPSNLPDNMVPSVKFILEQIEAGNTYAEYGWDN
jgi:8-oxo-dGTP diphosphatase